MITVKPINKDYYNGFIVEGHADYAERGQDIVCAGVSGAVHTVIFALEHAIGHYAESYQAPGYTKVQVQMGTDATDYIIDGFLEFLRNVHEKYKQTISIEGDYNNEARI